MIEKRKLWIGPIYHLPDVMYLVGGR